MRRCTLNVISICCNGRRGDESWYCELTDDAARGLALAIVFMNGRRGFEGFRRPRRYVNQGTEQRS